MHTTRVFCLTCHPERERRVSWTIVEILRFDSHRPDILRENDCEEWKAELERRAEVDKKNKRRKFYDEKKRRRTEEVLKSLFCYLYQRQGLTLLKPDFQRIHKLRCATGVYGFQALYKLLELPTHKLASMADIKKAFIKKS